VNGDDLEGSPSAAQELLEGGVRDVHVVAELRKRYVLDEQLAIAVVRYARAQSRRTVPRGQLTGNPSRS
jgi:hypothetical protein